MATLLFQPKEVGILFAIVILIRLLVGGGGNHTPRIVRGAALLTQLSTALPARIGKLGLLLSIVCIFFSLACLLLLLLLQQLLLLLLL